MNKKEEIVYTKAKIGKRMLAYFIDFGILFVSTVILFTLSNVIVTKAPFYKNNQQELIILRNESHLYIDGVSILTLSENNEDFPTYFDKKELLGNGLESFYVSPTYFSEPFTEFSEYNNRRLVALDNGVHLFVLNADKVIENPSYNNDEGWYQFYKVEYEDYAYGYLINNPKFGDLTRFTFITALIEVVASLTMSSIIFLLILPLTCFKRGRQTIGMKVQNIALINVKAINLSTGVYVGRFFFILFIFIYLNFFSFLIPSLVSITMLFFSKTSSSLVNYVFNDYVVDVTNQKIYYTFLELDEAKITLQNASIENKDFILK